MKKLLTVCLLAFAAAGATGCRSAAEGVKPKLMWLDCSANWVRFSYPDSIRYYVNKCREAGMTALVLDVKGTSSEVVYPSEYAPQVREWKGFTRPDFDFVGTFVDAAHDAGLEIYGSFNTFAEGNGVFRRGLIYDGHPEWQAVNYVPGKGLMPQLEIPDKKVLFANPALSAVQDHEIAIFKEVAQKYDFDGLLLDRGRYDNIQSDFSDFSRREFEAYIGKKLDRFPEDVYAWEEDGDGGWKRIDGPYFKQWIEWRASVIYDFFKRTKEELKAVKPGLKFGAYTGAWYPSYFEVGVNWASNTYDPSQDFAWATPEYKNYGYAELLDIFTNGNYYWNVTVDEYRRSNGLHKNETDSEMSKGDHLSVEGGCRYSRRLLGGRPFFGGMYVEDYKRDTTRFKRAVEMNLRESDGLMVFDIVHIINRDWWGPLQGPSAPMKRRRSNEPTADFRGAGAVVRRRRFRPGADRGARRVVRGALCRTYADKRRRREFRLERNLFRVSFYGRLAGDARFGYEKELLQSDRRRPRRRRRYDVRDGFGRGAGREAGPRRTYRADAETHRRRAGAHDDPCLPA